MPVKTIFFYSSPCLFRYYRFFISMFPYRCTNCRFFAYNYLHSVCVLCFSFRMRIEGLLIKEEFNGNMEWIRPSIESVILAAKGILSHFYLFLFLLPFSLPFFFPSFLFLSFFFPFFTPPLSTILSLSLSLFKIYF